MQWWTISETSKEKEESEKSVSSDQHHKNGIIKMVPIQTLLPSSSSLSTSGNNFNFPLSVSKVNNYYTIHMVSFESFHDTCENVYQIQVTKMIVTVDLKLQKSRLTPINYFI